MLTHDMQDVKEEEAQAMVEPFETVDAAMRALMQCLEQFAERWPVADPPRRYALSGVLRVVAEQVEDAAPLCLPLAWQLDQHDETVRARLAEEKRREDDEDR